MKKIFLILAVAAFSYACKGSSKKEEKKDNVEEMVTDDASHAPAEAAPEETAAADVKTYLTRGKIVSIGEADANNMVTVTIDHEAIPDFMEAMRMDLKADKAKVEAVAAGDIISFEMMQEGEGFKIKQLAKLTADTELKLKEAAAEGEAQGHENAEGHDAAH